MFGFSEKRKTRQSTKANKKESNAGNGMSILYTHIQKQNNLKKLRKNKAKTRSDSKRGRNNNTNSINVNDRYEKKMRTLADIAFLSTHIQNRNVHGGDWARDLKSLKIMNSEIPERMEDFMKIWYAVDTYHDLMDGTRAPLLRTLIFTGISNHIQCIDNFLYGRTLNLEKLIFEGNLNISP